MMMMISQHGKKDHAGILNERIVIFIYYKQLYHHHHQETTEKLCDDHDDRHIHTHTHTRHPSFFFHCQCLAS